MHSARRRGKSRSRILYWFRTPPGVRVGRSALDEDAIRLIEEHNPDVEFDWTRILKGQDAPPEPKPFFQERRARPRPRELPTPGPVSRPVEPPALQHTAFEATSPEVQDVRADAPFEEKTPALTREDPQPFIEESSEAVRDAVIEAGLDFRPEGAPEAAVEEPAEARLEMRPATPAQARLGSEGLSRLRARHAEVLARISEKVADPIRRDELKSQAERLNPDTWVTDGEVAAGLESYEAVFESLRGVVGRRRRKRRRRSSASASTGSAQVLSSEVAEGSGAGPGGGEEDGGPDEPGENL